MRFSAAFGFETLIFASVFSAAQSRKSHRLMAPLCKGSSREAGEGLTLKRRKPSKIYSKPQRHKTRFLPNPNTPQSAVRLTAPLLKRGQPIGVRLRCEKRKMRHLSLPRAPSVTLTRDTFLPEEGLCLRAAVPQNIPRHNPKQYRLRNIKITSCRVATPLSRLRRQLPSLKEGSLSVSDCGAKRKIACFPFSTFCFVFNRLF